MAEYEITLQRRGFEGWMVGIRPDGRVAGRAKRVPRPRLAKLRRLLDGLIETGRLERGRGPLLEGWTAGWKLVYRTQDAWHAAWLDGERGKAPLLRAAALILSLAPPRAPGSP